MKRIRTQLLVALMAVFIMPAYASAYATIINNVQTRTDSGNGASRSSVRIYTNINGQEDELVRTIIGATTTKDFLRMESPEGIVETSVVLSGEDTLGPEGDVSAFGAESQVRGSTVAPLLLLSAEAKEREDSDFSLSEPGMAKEDSVFFLDLRFFIHKLTAYVFGFAFW